MSLYTTTTRLTARATTQALKLLTASQKLSPHTLLDAPNSTTTQKRSFFVLPFGLDIGLLTAIAYNSTKLKHPDPRVVLSVFGPFPGTKESELFPDKVVNCIAHRGAGKDAPENTIEAFKHCIDQGCKFFEFDVRASRDGKLVLLHDPGLERLSVDSTVTNVSIMDWDSIKDIDVGSNHPNRKQFKEVHLCLLEEAVEFLVEQKARMIIDIKDNTKEMIEGILKLFRQRQQLYSHAAITSFNPLVIYQIRRKDPEIVGAMSYRPYAFSSQDYEAATGPTNPTTDKLFAYGGLRCLDVLHSSAWRWLVRWSGVSAVLLHKDIVSPIEIHYWRNREIRCAGWCVDSPVEKMYWRGILKTPYLANTLVGEPNDEEKKLLDSEEILPARKIILE